MDVINFLFEIIMLFFICISFFGLVLMLTLIVMHYIATPIYAGMIFLESLDFNNKKNIPDFFQFRQPTNGMYRYYMDMIASICTLIGLSYFFELKRFSEMKMTTQFYELFFRAKIQHFSLPIIFCICIGILYMICNRCEPDNRDAITKLRDLYKFPSLLFSLIK